MLFGCACVPAPLHALAATRQVQVQESHAAARALARRGQRADAKLRLRECSITRRRLMTAQTMLGNMEHMMCEIEDSKMYSYSIGAMSDIARQFNYSTANMDSMYKRLTSTQDKLHEFHDASEEIRAVMSESADYQMSINDDDLEQELNTLLEDDELPVSEPPRNSGAVTAPLRPPVVHDRFTIEEVTAAASSATPAEGDDGGDEAAAAAAGDALPDPPTHAPVPAAARATPRAPQTQTPSPPPGGGGRGPPPPPDFSGSGGIGVGVGVGTATVSGSGAWPAGRDAVRAKFSLSTPAVAQ